MDSFKILYLYPIKSWFAPVWKLFYSFLDQFVARINNCLTCGGAIFLTISPVFVHLMLMAAVYTFKNNFKQKLLGTYSSEIMEFFYFFTFL
jgi:hypothetical protein